MFNWLKKKAKISFSNPLQALNFERKMFVDQEMMDAINAEKLDDRISVCIHNEEGDTYLINLEPTVTIYDVVAMAVGHFFNKFGNATENNECSSSKTDTVAPVCKDSYILIRVRNMATLAGESTVNMEKFENNEHFLLIKDRKSFRNYLKTPAQFPDGKQVKESHIRTKQHGLESLNHNREANPMKPELDFKIAFRQIVLTMIEASIHLIALDDDASDQFILVFDYLVKRHKQKVDKTALQELIEMGFPEASAIRSLQRKKNSHDALEWLVENKDNDIFRLFSSDERRLYFFSQPQKDPTKIVMEEFNIYIDEWFVPEQKAVENLVSLSYGEQQVVDALREARNIENIAKEILLGNTTAKETINRGFDRDSPVMSAILQSSVVQTALAKPKTLFALMVLCETPNNVNVWLSDPETHAVVSQILRIYHAEKHRIGTVELHEPECNIDANTDCIPMKEHETLSPYLNSSTIASLPVSHY